MAIFFSELKDKKEITILDSKKLCRELFKSRFAYEELGKRIILNSKLLKYSNPIRTLLIVLNEIDDFERKINNTNKENLFQ